MESESALLSPTDTPDELAKKLRDFQTDFHALRQQIGKVIVGQTEVVELSLIALIAGGHVLLEGVPGLGKTLLVRTLAKATGCEFSRIQFTPDLMPADLIGTNVLLERTEGKHQFDFQPGPVFTNVLLADEINRATPKTQSALLEAMQERSVTVAGVTYSLDRPFFVMATQNPLEMEGTYPLPEAQLDRFFFKLLAAYPSTQDMELILDRTTELAEPTAEPVLTNSRLVEMSALARQIPLAPSVRHAAIDLVMRTHPQHEGAPDCVRRYVRYGSSPRGAQAMILAAKIRAILDHRFHVACDDLWAVAPAALRHRLILSFEARGSDVTADDVLAELLASSKGPPAPLQEDLKTSAEITSPG